MAPFPGKMLLFYVKHVRDVFIVENTAAPPRIFLSTKTGKGIKSQALTKIVTRSARFFLGNEELAPTPLSLRHCFATYYWRQWRDGKVWSHITCKTQFMRKLAFRLATSPKQLKDVYINERLVIPIGGDALIEYPEDL